METLYGYTSDLNSDIDINGINYTKRLIDFERSEDKKSPYIFRESDFEMLVNSGMNFARKFDETVDKEIIAKLKEHVLISSFQQAD